MKTDRQIGVKKDRGAADMRSAGSGGCCLSRSLFEDLLIDIGTEELRRREIVGALAPRISRRRNSTDIR